MTDRNRNFAILTLVGLLLAGSLAVLLTKTTKLGLDLKGGVELVYEAKPTKQAPTVTGDAIDRSIDIMRKRVDALGVSEPEIQRSGENQITVSLPDVKNAKEAADTVGTTAQMFFYDWEKNVIGPEGKADPADPSITGGQYAGSVTGSACKPGYDAIIRASRRPEQKNTNQATGAKYYLLNDTNRAIIAGPEPTVRDLNESDKVIQFKSAQAKLAEKKQKKTRIKEIKPGTIVVRAETPDGTKAKPDCFYVLNDAFALKGTDIKNPEQNFDQFTQAPNVTFDFTSSGRKKWKQTTKEIAERGQNLVGTVAGNTNQHFAIILDNELISVPYIDFRQNPDGIDGANGSEISGGFTIDTAQSLANELKYGALPVALKLVSQSQVSATLGKEALDQGMLAGIIGFAIVALFLLIFYRVLGLIAVGALVVYAIYFYALIKLIPITMTLPGIAGLILTIGVAADANIVIFERVKEEIRAGRSVGAAITQGYKKGIAAIVDANVVTFMTAFILFMIATAGVRGFAFTLGVGTLVSLFTAVLLTQAVLSQLGKTRLMSSPSALGQGKVKEGPSWRGFDFMGASRWFFSASGVILVIGALAIGSQGLNFGIDFESGTRIEATFVKNADESAIRDVLASEGVDKGSEVQRVTKKNGDEAVQISTEQLQPDKVDEVVQKLNAEFQVKGQPSTQSIGPTFGNTVAKSAIIAIIASLIVISAYIALRFEWKYAVPVLIALMHDLLITAGVYSLTGREVTTSTVAALLTILGYSLYDTIIVFDRIRENVPRMPRAAYSQIVNRSMSEVLTRSLATSFCTLLPVLSLLLFGGDTLKDFAFALMVGVLSGAYSSVFIAGPVLTHWKERESVYVRRAIRIKAANNGIVPAYASGTHAQEVQVAERKKRASLTAPEDPNRQVSRAEFDAMVRELDVEKAAPEPTADDLTRDLTPDELVLKDDKKQTPRRRQTRNKKGRPR